jgi:hypothetical protein
MAEEFIINSKEIESKINQLLPSQGGFGTGVDFSASTMVIPIVDLTESAEGSNFREDLQTAFSLTSITSFSVENASSTIINNTGYFRVFGNFSGLSNSSTTDLCTFSITDGLVTKNIQQFRVQVNSSNRINLIQPFDFVIKLEAGDSVIATSNRANNFLVGNTRQIATKEGELVNP